MKPMMPFARVVLACCLAQCAGRAMAAGDHLRKVALVVGNAAYVNALPLANPLNDAADVCSALRKLDFVVICKTNLASKREFKDAIFEFTGKLNENSVALFYFAGHGLQIDGLNYLIPTRAALRTKSDIEDESVQINYLMNELEARRPALNIFVLDACRDNPFVSPVRGYAPTMGLASQLFTPRNSIVAMSTGPGQLSLDGSGRNGTFTRNLLNNVLTPRMTIEDMFKAVGGGTRSDAQQVGRRQDPQITSSYTERFCMAGCGERQAGDSPAAAARAELEHLQDSLAAARASQAALDEQHSALLKKQAELEALQRRVTAAPAPADVRTRNVEVPDERPKQVPIVPTF
jgi:uncharacterized caspase-like protein